MVYTKNRVLFVIICVLIIIDILTVQQGISVYNITNTFMCLVSLDKMIISSAKKR